MINYFNFIKFRNKTLGQGYNSAAKHLPAKCKVLSSISGTKKHPKKQKSNVDGII